jgi:hypothetical protein
MMLREIAAFVPAVAHGSVFSNGLPLYYKISIVDAGKLLQSGASK